MQFFLEDKNDKTKTLNNLSDSTIKQIEKFDKKMRSKGFKPVTSPSIFKDKSYERSLKKLFFVKTKMIDKILSSPYHIFNYQKMDNDYNMMIQYILIRKEFYKGNFVITSKYIGGHIKNNNTGKKMIYEIFLKNALKEKGSYDWFRSFYYNENKKKIVEKVFE